MKDIDPYLFDSFVAIFKDKWRQHGSCRGQDPQTFFQEEDNELLRSLCDVCPCRIECLDDALYFRDGGFRAGFSEKERRSVVFYRRRHHKTYLYDMLK